ncbi:MAG: hypothetical protein QXU32_13560 [Nitrososphaerales archaeon]
MRLIDQLYDPKITLISITNAQFSKGPIEACYATRLLRPQMAIPTHYLASNEHIPYVSTLQDVEEFKRYVGKFSFGKVEVVVPTVGEPFTYKAGKGIAIATAENKDEGDNNSTIYMAATGAGTFAAGFVIAKLLNRRK